MVIGQRVNRASVLSEKFDRLERCSPLAIALLIYVFALGVLLICGLSFHFRASGSMLEADEAEYFALAGSAAR